jgi:predicted glycoside hydrolase/deacetylase ChbG (UPF0249 family)
LKRLIVNADDFGFTRDVNAGIIEAHRKGILTTTTLMADGPSFDDAVRLARENPTLDIGSHLVLVGMPGLPDSVGQLVQAVALKRIDIYGEFKRQVGKIVDAGIVVSHADTHKHTHLLPPVLEAMARVASEFGIGWIRRPFDFLGHPGPSRFAGRLMGFAQPHFRRVLARYNLRSTDHFAGFRLTGVFDSSQLTSLIQALPDGTTEFMCHPGFCTAELRGARTRLKESREQELRALIDEGVRAALDRNGVALSYYRDLEWGGL